MILNRIKLYRFRNLSDATLEFGPGAHFFCGNNGQGKTNLIEAIHILSSGKSFRAIDNSELVRFGDEGDASSSSCSVFGTIQTRLGESDVGINFARRSKQLFINRSQVKSERVCRKNSQRKFYPIDLQLIKSGPGLRRRFIDKHLVDINPPLLQVMLDYQRALKHKNELLKSSKAQDLDAWDLLLAQSGSEITKARLSFVTTLEKTASAYLEALSLGREDLKLSLKSNLILEKEVLANEDILAVMRKFRPKELKLGSALVGPHRDDMIVTTASLDARSFASQGQTRSLVLALKFGVLDMIKEAREEPPLILLDDVDSELDQVRKVALYNILKRGLNQAFITGTHMSSELEDVMALKLHRIEQGRVQSE